MTGNNNGFLRAHQSKLDTFHRFSDAFLIALSMFATTFVFGVEVNQQYLVAMFIAILMFSIAAESHNVYHCFRGAKLRQLVTPLLTSWGVAVFGLLSLAYMLKVPGDFSRLAVGTWVLATPVVLVAWRVIIRSILSELRRSGHNSRKVAIVGAEKNGVMLARIIESTPSFGLKLLGFYDDRQATDERIQEEIRHRQQLRGNINDVIDLAKNKQVDLIYIALSLKGQDRALRIINELADTSVAVHLVPDLFVFDLLHSRLINIGPIPTLSVYESPYFGVSGWAKRMEDIVLSSVILAIIAVPMLFIAAGVKLSSRGPVLFKQRRYGIDGSEIKVWKFRSMTASDDGDKVVQATRNDARVTKFGAFLRRTSLDELPQFFNVLMGEMSIVGPRPHAVAHNEEYRRIISGYMLRHKVKPGITGWAQVNGWRGETETVDKMEKRVEFDIEYIRTWSVWLDLMIVARTVLSGFTGKTAY